MHVVTAIRTKAPTTIPAITSAMTSCKIKQAIHLEISSVHPVFCLNFEMTTTEIKNFIWAMVRTTCSQPATIGTKRCSKNGKMYLKIAFAFDALLV
jgi:hypothetical protein